ncbi:unnamed protein product [Durusdinium trenchii]|uniref:Endonuclease/exonuclease/phosphatase domain-containing protein n=1 Tax=Durusdinium trenchii TaxID=1381693 RepID=A0ABP0KVE7_9DINO
MTSTARRALLRLGCWNQHRQGSYAQRDCPWIAGLKAKANRQERDELLKTLRLQYAELRPWADAFDLVALQEVDQALRTCLGAEGLGPDRWVESAPHVDARGIPVDSTTAVLLGPASRWRIRGKAHCELTMPTGSGRVARRDHCGILLEGTFPLVLCSVHLHPPSGTAAYLQYLEPLKEMMLSLVPEQPGHSPALALLGDWNCSQGQLKELMAEDAFWSSFQSVAPMEATAFESNPCATGDFMLFRPAAPSGHGLQWHCQAEAEADFGAFRAYSRAVLADTVQRLPWLRALAASTEALQQVRLLERQLEDLKPKRTVTPEDGVPSRQEVDPATTPSLSRDRWRHPWRPPAPVRQEVVSDLLRSVLQLHGQLDRQHQRLKQVQGGLGMVLPKSLDTSDHRPLVFEGFLE